MPTKHRRSKPTLRVTKDYSLFHLVDHNRPLDVKKRRNLRRSMEVHGFIPAYPIHCARNGNGTLDIQDGQGRYWWAKELGLPVYYVVTDGEGIDIPAINNTQRKWTIGDYVGSFASQGMQSYQELLDFSDVHKIPLSLSMALLADVASYHGNKGTRVAYKTGGFKIRDRARADRVARIFVEMRAQYKALGSRFFIEALSAYTLIPEVDDARLIKGAKRCPELVQRYGTRDGFLTMLEAMYNYGRHKREPIKIPAENALRNRNPAFRGKRKKP